MELKSEEEKIIEDYLTKCEKKRGLEYEFISKCRNGNRYVFVFYCPMHDKEFHKRKYELKNVKKDELSVCHDCENNSRKKTLNELENDLKKIRLTLATETFSYNNNQCLLPLKCLDCGHQFHSRIENAKSRAKKGSGYGCHLCNKIFFNRENLKKIKKNTGSKLKVSGDYVEQMSYLTFECKECGFEFRRTAKETLKRDIKCPVCYPTTNRLTTNLVKSRLEQEGIFDYIPLEIKRNNKETKVKFKHLECKKSTELVLRSLLYGKTSCEHCRSREEVSISRVQKVAENRGHELVVDSFIDGNNKADFICRNHGAFKADPLQYIHDNSNCFACGNETRAAGQRVDYNKILKIAEKRNEKLVTTKVQYDNLKNISSKATVQCPNGHIYHPSFRNYIHSNVGCIECIALRSHYKREAICRLIIEKLTEKKFKKDIALKLTDNEKNRYESKFKHFPSKPLRVDGLNDELMIAFEHHGEQHYGQARGIFYQTKEELEKRKCYDEIKRKVLLGRGFDLIEISYEVKIKDLFDQIGNKLLAITKENNEKLFYKIKSNRDKNVSSFDALSELYKLKVKYK